MINIKSFTDKFTQTLEDTFPNRVWFIGLQGSYGRGEATESSDIDMVVILDQVSPEDVDTYNAMLDTLPHRDLICGFLSGKSEILNWEASDLFQFYYDTKPLKGSLEEILPLIDNTAIDRAIKSGACNIYHACVHNMLYDKSKDILKGLYKSASFLVQAKHFRESGKYISLLNDLSKVVSSEDKIIIDIFTNLKNNCKFDFGQASQALFLWAKNHIGEA